jgi:hypothetical protein
VTTLRPGANLSIDRGDLPGAALNRSKVAYARNPEEERRRYSRGSRVEGEGAEMPWGDKEGEDWGGGGDGGDGDVDTSMTVLTITAADVDDDSEVRGAIAWYAVHGTSLRSSNRMLSGDNKGVASWLAETALRGDQADRRMKNAAVAAAAAAADADDDGASIIFTDREGAVRAVLDAFGGRGDDHSGSVGGGGGGGGGVSGSDAGVAEVLRSPRGAARAVAAAAAAAAVAGPSRAGRAGRGHGAVVAFPQSASGDVSPNVRGAWCKNCGGGGGGGGDANDAECEECDPVTGRTGTFHHVILQSKHQLMTASIAHETNMTPGSECNPSHGSVRRLRHRVRGAGTRGRRRRGGVRRRRGRASRLGAQPHARRHAHRRRRHYRLCRLFRGILLFCALSRGSGVQRTRLASHRARRGRGR